MDTKKLNYWLAVFLVETRQVTGESYTLQLLYTALCQAFFDTCEVLMHRSVQTFFARNNADSALFRTPWTLVQNTEEGRYWIGEENSEAIYFSKEEEQQLWSTGALGVQDPVSLQRAVFFSNGKNFCLRGGNEHREFKLSQLKKEVGGYRYTENASKNRAGGQGQLKLQKKTVFIAAVPEAGERCHCGFVHQ